MAISSTTTRHLLLIATLSVVAMLPAFYWGVPSGNDQLQHFQFAGAVYDSVRSGVLYPSLSADSDHGFGGVGLRFYPPLAYYLLSLFYILLGDWFFAAQAAFTLAFFVGGVGTYLWAREEFTAETALIAAALFTFVPYHINLIYTNFLLGEFFAAAILPFCFLFVTRVCRRGGALDLIGLAMSFALLVLTHLPITMIGTLALIIYAVALINRSTIISTLLKLAASALVGMVLSSFYWTRMIPELDWVKHSATKYFADTFSYRNNFLFRPSHFVAGADDVLNLWLADLMLTVVLLISIPTAVYLFRRSLRASKYVMAVSVVLVGAIFMASPLSDPAWRVLSFLQRVQFPWRWLSIVSVCGAVFASIGLERVFAALKTGNSRVLAFGIVAILVCLVFTDALIVRGAVYVPRAELKAQLSDLAEATMCECWWPTWAEPAAFAQKEKVFAPGRFIAVDRWTQTSRRFTAEAGVPVQATIATFYYPRWQATINSMAVAVDKDAEGRLTIELPAERSDVALEFREPEIVKTAYVVAPIAWISILFLLGGLLLKRHKAPSLHSGHD